MKKKLDFLLQFGKTFVSIAMRAVETKGFAVNKFWTICILFSSRTNNFFLFMIQITPHLSLSAKLVLCLWPAKYQWA